MLDGASRHSDCIKEPEAAVRARLSRRLAERNGAGAKELTQLCVRDLERFRATPQNDDDVTILTVRRSV